MTWRYYQYQKDKKVPINRMTGTNKTIIDLCQRKPCLAKRQEGILFWILKFIAHLIMMRQVFSNVFVLFGNFVNMMREVSNTCTMPEFTHSIKQPCWRCDIKFIWQFTALSLQIMLNLDWKNVKTVVQACKLLQSHFKGLWCSSKKYLLIPLGGLSS